MKRLLLITFLVCCEFVQAQQWAGVLAPARAISWQNTGIPGGLPDASWSQCGSTIAPYGTSGSPGSTSTINSQINGCAAPTQTGSLSNPMAGNAVAWTYGSAAASGINVSGPVLKGPTAQ